MVHFQSIDQATFLKEYWQKKPLLIRQALPDFVEHLSADELAGLAMEEDVESRIVFETPNKAPFWHLKRGPFLESDFETLPKTHWTLLVQGVDRLIPEMASLLDHFDFIPQWRLDDLMISYAPKQGSVGPHYDHYDVFLYQSSGQRHWSLTTKACHDKNSLEGTELRIMAQFEVEEEYTLMPGDMLYLPPHVGHHGVSLSDDCMTYSFGFRRYQSQELWDSFGDYLSEKSKGGSLYKDPNWSELQATSAIPKAAWMNAKDSLQQLLNQDNLMQSWFGCFATRLDQAAEQQIPMPLEEYELPARSIFVDELLAGGSLARDTTCRIAYIPHPTKLQLFINGYEWDSTDLSDGLLELVANHRHLGATALKPFLQQEANQLFLYELFKLQWLQLI
jgi:50S ribosomal protein L16 3-hydroxylase